MPETEAFLEEVHGVLGGSRGHGHPVTSVPVLVNNLREENNESISIE